VIGICQFELTNDLYRIVGLSNIEVKTMKNKKSKVGSAPASSTQTGKKGRKITMNREVEIELLENGVLSLLKTKSISKDRDVEIELEDGLVLMITTEDAYDLWKTTGFPIKFYTSKEDEAPYIIEKWKDWFNLPKDFQDACFELYVNRIDADKFVFQAYKE
jgi:hypothetical protein